MVEKPALRYYFEDSQHEFAALAGSLTAEQWATPSLCEGWTVREAVVHTAWHIHLKPSPAATRDFLQFLVLGTPGSAVTTSFGTAHSRTRASFVGTNRPPRAARTTYANRCCTRSTFGDR